MAIAGSGITITTGNYGITEKVTAYFDCTTSPCYGKSAIGSGTVASDDSLSLPITIPATDTPGTSYSIGVLGGSSGGFTTVSYTVTGGRTAARVASLTARHVGVFVLLLWRVVRSGGVLGFDVLRGGQRLNGQVVPVHVGAWYRYRVTASGEGRYVLEVLLRGGRRVEVALPHIR